MTSFAPPMSTGARDDYNIRDAYAEANVPQPFRLATRGKVTILASMSGQGYAHIYLSPHLDDVVLSCGATIYQQTRAGARVLVVTFFAGSPQNDAPTAFARELKARWGNAADPVGVRRQEDLAALRVLGAEGLHLPFLDCVYRLDPRSGEAYYPTVQHIFADVHPGESGFAQALWAAFTAQVPEARRATLYVPLTAGHHVDHILVQRAALVGLCEGWRTLFYEDYPYAGDALAVARAREGWPEHCWNVQTVFVDEAALQAKMDAVACYISQLSTFWSGPDEMRDALRAQALAVGAGRYGENYWALAQACR